MSAAETLLGQALAAINVGELATAADCFERAAASLSGGDAAAAWESAARLRLSTNDLPRARAALDRAELVEPGSERVVRLRAEITDVGGDVPQRMAAWLAVVASRDASARRFANIQLGTLARATGDAAASAGCFQAALADVPDHGEALLRAEILLELAIAKTQLEDMAGAEAALDAAERDLPSDDQGIRTRIIGQRGVLAFTRGDEVRALELARAARAGAVASNDVLTYLAASSLIASIHEHAGRLVDAYDTYIRTRESLADLLGDEGRGLAQPAVTLFEERLGPAQFAAVWNEWKARRAS